MSLEVIVTSTPEVVELTGAVEVVESVNEPQVFEVTPSGPDVVTETATDTSVVIETATDTSVVTETATDTSVVIETQTATFTDRWVEAQIIETALQGPPGPPGPAAGSYPAKRLTYADGQLVEVLLFSDAAATQLAEQRVLFYDAGVLSSIEYYDVLGVLLNTRSFMYTGGVLVGISDS